MSDGTFNMSPREIRTWATSGTRRRERVRAFINTSGLSRQTILINEFHSCTLSIEEKGCDDAMKFSNVEMLDISLVYDAYEEKVITKRWYVEKYRGKHSPSRRVFQKLCKMQEEIGDFHSKHIARTEDRINIILVAVNQNHHINTRQKYLKL